jgi:8-oxo-dGTP pyrophosphatase MutT (NUDIX family)
MEDGMDVRTMETDLIARLRTQGLDEAVLMELEPFDDDELPWLRADGPIAWLSEFWAHEPGKGAGRRAMVELCLMADEIGMTVGLNPWAHNGSKGLRQDQLERFYQSLGFGWRRDHVMTRDPMAPTVVDVRSDVGYLISPNRVELILDDCNTRRDVTRTSFVIPVMEDGSIVMATSQNDDRGVEVPGGHIEEGERMDEAAIRECHEETGARVVDCKPIGHLRMISQGVAPEGWRYPHPLGYQMFHAARVASIDEYVENRECRRPTIVSDISILRPHVQLLARRARWVMGIR